MSKKVWDVVIIGGGAVGLSCAYFLARAGRDVCVLDGDKPGSGASAGNAGLITPSHALPLCRPGVLKDVAKSLFDKTAPLALRPGAALSMTGWFAQFARNCNDEASQRILRGRLPLLQSSRILTEKLIKAENIHCEWMPTGLLSVCQTDAGFERLTRTVEAAQAAGLSAELIAGDALKRREPALLDGLPGGALFEGDGKLMPEDFINGLIKACTDKGVTIVSDKKVVQLNVEKGKVHSAYTDPGVHEAKEFVLAAGAWSAPLAANFGLKLPIQPGKGYALTTQLPDPHPKRALLLEERSIAVTPYANSFRLAGTMEFAGFDPRRNRARRDALMVGATQYLTEPMGRGQPEEWAGFRPMTPDDTPLIGKTPGLDNLMMACGHNMLGMSMAVGTGRLVTELLAGSKTHVNPAPFNPARFGDLKRSNPLQKLQRKQ